MTTERRRIVTDPTAADDARARADGLTNIRDVHQLRCSLPAEPATIRTRAFVPGGTDERAFIEVNNRAFSFHPDQSGMTTERLHADLAADWFDPAGFLLHERDGRLAGFCWTKRHPATATDPALGEIYVIGVDPDFQGLGLGRELVLAGLAHLAGVGETVGMLYVDETNAAAVGLYDAMGFVLHHVDRLYEPPV